MQTFAHQVGRLMMKKRMAVLTVSILFLSSFYAAGKVQLLYDFEDGPENWTKDWGLKQKLDVAKRRTRHGKQSLLVKHHFKPKADNIGFRILFDSPKDFTIQPGFVGFSAWIYFPSGDAWQAQMYTHTGNAWKWREGKLNENLHPGWHQIKIMADEIEDLSEIRDIGIQVKNHKLNYKAKIYVDRVEALYLNKQ